MSAFTHNPDHAARRRATERARVAGRSRRSDAGSVTEMAMALLRDARENEERRPFLRRGADAGWGSIASSRAARRGARPTGRPEA
jgi:hypothetical protein